MTIHPADAPKYAAALLRSRTEWTCDSIAGSTRTGANGHELEVDAINDTVTEFLELASAYGDRRIYSDGRVVEQSCPNQPGTRRLPPARS